MGDSDYLFAFSKRDYGIFLKDGVPEKKLYILSHPLARENREFFKKVFFDKLKKEKKSGKITLLLLPNIEIGFRRSDYSLIPREERYKKWKEIATLVSENLPNWKILIKPHPDLKGINKIKGLFKFISGDISVADPKEPVDKFIEMADIIIGLPLSSSTTLFTASLQCPQKPIISLDFLHEVMGDYYREFNGIDYVENAEKFLRVLKLIKDNKYRRVNYAGNQKEKNPKEFGNTVELLEYLLQNKVNLIKE